MFICTGNTRVSADRTHDYFPILKDKTVGLIANQSSLIGKTHMVDTL